ncbi:MAG: type II toxin-antitoxin system RelE/ParE family toxin [Patescibacteria group bacterium]
MAWKVKFFQTKRGDYPVKEFIEKLEKKTYTRALKSITLLSNFGPFVRMPYSKKIAPHLYELRIKGAESIRILYVQVNQVYYLVHIFKKKTDKIPMREIKTALDRAKELR